ncbi:MAG: ATP-dependent zinc protease [Pseudomonadota bacterium]|jgi:hypothetical protein
MISMRRCAGIAAVLSLLGGSAAARADDAKVIAGWVEKVYFAAAPGHEVKAKLDSGAKTSSVNARDVEDFERDGRPWVRFELVLPDEDDRTRVIAMERPVTRYVRIKEHRGDHDRRPVVELEFCFVGRFHRAQFSLVDRTRFHYPVLLGRRFLAGVALIDPGATFLTEPDCAESGTGADQP